MSRAAKEIAAEMTELFHHWAGVVPASACGVWEEE